MFNLPAKFLQANELKISCSSVGQRAKATAARTNVGGFHLFVVVKTVVVDPILVGR